MKKIWISFIVTLIILSACNSEDWKYNEEMSFEIPETFISVSNSGAITVNGEETALSGEKLEVWDTLTDTVLDMRADYFDQVETTSLSNFPGLKLIETVPSLGNANGIDNLTVVSDARTREFGTQNSLLLTDYSLLTRSIMIVDENNVIKYIEYANEVTSELDLMNALAYLKSITQ